MSTQQVLDQIDDAIRDPEVGPDAMRCGAPADIRDRLPSRASLGGVDLASGQVFVNMTLDLSPFIEGMKRAVEACARFARFVEARAARDRRQKLRNGPPPLCIDGREYRRRQRRRTLR